MDFGKIFKISLVVILLVAVVYMIVGLFFTSDTKSEFSGFGSVVKPTSKPQTQSSDKLEVSMDKIIINVSGTKYKYMKADISLKMSNDAAKTKLKENMPQIRQAIMRFSATQNGDKLATPQGKEEFKKNLTSLLRDSYGLDMQAVYFRNFVLAQ
ncbi:MAG: flagellar basal body-associated FliL family protein [Sulfurospirillum sp.]|nr:flagellar basal body-associated FliL family protein [Sulfurospirillum sp.]